MKYIYIIYYSDLDACVNIASEYTNKTKAIRLAKKLEKTFTMFTFWVDKCAVDGDGCISLVDTVYNK